MKKQNFRGGLFLTTEAKLKSDRWN